ncbi:MAG: hypothetical protein K6F85_02880 [Bacteroidales bacterium]|nr:hypothetical protein [Bacteroidales bacterium]
MNIDKHIVIGERPEIKATILFFPIVLVFVIRVLLMDPSDVWMWIITALILVGTVGAIRDYVLIKKNKAVGTTIVVDKNGVTVEKEDEPVGEFPWDCIDSLTIKRFYGFDDWTLQTKPGYRPKSQYSYQILYNRPIIPRANLWTIKQKVAHFSNDRVQINFNHYAQRRMKIYRLFSPYK